MRWPVTLCILTVFLLNSHLLHAIQQIEQGEQLLVGLIVNGQEDDAVIVQRRGDLFFLPFTILSEQLHLEAKQSETEFLFSTPIGETAMPKETIITVNSEPFFPLTALQDYFHILSKFDSSQYAILMDVPWRPGSEQEAVSPQKKIQPTPDVQAPMGMVSFLRTDIEAFPVDRGDQRWSITEETGGRFANGAWMMRLTNQDFANTVDSTQYYWGTNWENIALRLGTGSGSSNSLLSNWSFTGGQLAWSNKGILSHIDFDGNSESDNFIRDQNRYNRTVEGIGPPAGVAELRFDDVPVARVRIRLDGTYIFRDFPVRGGQFQRIQVHVYKRSWLVPPVAIHDFTYSTIRSMLPAGELIVRTGGGHNGILSLDTNKRNYNSDKYGGFISTRYGLTQKTTLEFIGQQFSTTSPASSSELYTSINSTLGDYFGYVLGYARKNDRNGYTLELGGGGDSWNMRWATDYKEIDFENNEFGYNCNNYARLYYQFRQDLGISLNGRYQIEDGFEVAQFILPGGNWRPIGNLSLSASPDSEGEYTFRAYLPLGTFFRVSQEYDHGQKSHSTEFDWDYDDDLTFHLTNTYQNADGRNSTAVHADYTRKEEESWQFSIGVIDSEINGSVSWQKRFSPGLYVRAEVYSSLAEVTDEEGWRAGLSLVWDLGFSNAGVQSINRSELSHTRGGIAGKIVPDKDAGFNPEDINKIGFYVNRRKVSQRQVNGGFFIGNVPEGVYEVAIDSENLPLELVPDRTSYLVGVSNSAITSVDFMTHAEYGVAGRIVNETEKPQPGVEIVITLLNEKDVSQNKKMHKAMSDQFGYYRMDGLWPGQYTLLPVLDRCYIKGTNFTISNDYIFGVDLTVTNACRPEEIEK